MPDNTKKQTLEHVENTKQSHTDYLVRNDPDLQGKVDIDVRTNGRYDVTVYKGDSHEPRKIEDVTKKQLLQMLKEQI